MQLVALIKIKRLVGAEKVSLLSGEVGLKVLSSTKGKEPFFWQERLSGRTKGKLSVVQPNGRLAEGGDVIGNLVYSNSIKYLVYSSVTELFPADF